MNTLEELREMLVRCNKWIAEGHPLVEKMEQYRKRLVCAIDEKESEVQ